jgi:hypothetical protein
MPAERVGQPGYLNDVDSEPHDHAASLGPAFRPGNTIPVVYSPPHDGRGSSRKEFTLNSLA